MKTWIRSVVCIAVAMLVAGIGSSQEKPKPADPPKKPTVMQRKLAHAQKVLEGLALNDFDKIGDGTEGLALCAQEAGWKVHKTRRYELYSNDFVRDLDGLKAAVKKKHVDAAALAYVGMTLTCVKCHQYVREEAIGSLPPLPAPAVRVAAR